MVAALLATAVRLPCVHSSHIAARMTISSCMLILVVSGIALLLLVHMHAEVQSGQLARAPTQRVTTQVLYNSEHVRQHTQHNAWHTIAALAGYFAAR